MREAPLYTDHQDENFWGDGEPPALTDQRQCQCRGIMWVVLSSIRMGRPPIRSWSWVCRTCSRRLFGGRWREDE